MAADAIVVRDVTKAFGTTVAVSHIARTEKAA